VVGPITKAELLNGSRVEGVTTLKWRIPKKLGRRPIDRSALLNVLREHIIKDRRAFPHSKNSDERWRFINDVARWLPIEDDAELDSDDGEHSRFRNKRRLASGLLETLQGEPWAKDMPGYRGRWPKK
jgi:hypothetical protein